MNKATALLCPYCKESVKDWYQTPCPCCGRKFKVFCDGSGSMMEDFKESRDCPHIKATPFPFASGTPSR